MITREVQLTTRIAGVPGREHFTVVETDVDGEVVVRTDYLGLAATFLELMCSDCHLPIPAWQPGQRIGVTAIGTVVRSASPDLREGDLVQSMSGWSTHSAGPAASYVKLDRDVYLDPSYHLGQGPTAYYGIADVAKVGSGDVVFVSGAAGWLDQDTFVFPQTVVEAGIDAVPETFLSLLRGGYRGNVSVRLA
jgi:hypothetical protein